MTEKLEGKVALVTGGARGLGEAICRNLAAAGMKVAVADIRSDMAADVAGSLRDEGLEAGSVRVDVSDPHSAREAVDVVVQREGGLDVLVNNAGIDRTVSVEELEVEEWRDIVGVNMTGPFLMSKFALPHLRESNSPYIINIASTAAKRAWPNASAYHATKWGLLGFTHALHSEMRAEGVKVTALVAGGMRTPFLLDRFPDIDVETLQDPANVAETVHYLLTQPAETVIPELMVIPMTETSWP